MQHLTIQISCKTMIFRITKLCLVLENNVVFITYVFNTSLCGTWKFYTIVWDRCVTIIICGWWRFLFVEKCEAHPLGGDEEYYFRLLPSVHLILVTQEEIFLSGGKKVVFLLGDTENSFMKQDIRNQKTCLTFSFQTTTTTKF